MFSEIASIVAKDLRMELRQKHALGSIFIYVVASVFVAYIGFRQIVDVATWNALFWIIVLFAAFNAASRSFSVENSRRRLYLFTLASPESVILAKMLFNALLLMLMVLASFAIFAFLIGTQVLQNTHWPGLAAALILGGISLAFILTLVAALAAHTDNNPGIMAVLGLPIILPMLLILIRLSKNAIDGISWSVNATYCWQLLAISLLSVALSYILFPYLWRE